MIGTDDHNENDEKTTKRAGPVARLKKLYEDRPVPFAVGVIGISAILLLVGGLMTGEISAMTLAPGP
ncbi:hypothetical protein [Brevibacterium oceani]|uniref:hypothetical protein n=1 Tax=Brevibacterium oceani TaxID=358099 RepID=UPI0015E68426|nr:hypothetical protein [Brevibacterium oceani]